MINRRQFARMGLLSGSALVVGAMDVPAWSPKARRATDVVYLGPDRVKLTRLAIGTGTRGGSVQRQLGIHGLADLLHFGYDQGLIFWDSADAYQTHPHLKEALKRIPREKVTILTKTRSQTAEAMRADLDRFRREVGTDYFDIVLLHAVTSANWPDERAGAMEVLSEAHLKGIIRTHGVSCHSIEALQRAASTPWVHVALARINPIGVNMDAEPGTVVRILQTMRAAGKGIIGMKILAEGVMRDRVDQSLGYALSLHCVDCFTIGPANRQEVADLIQRIPANSKLATAA